MALSKYRQQVRMKKIQQRDPKVLFIPVIMLKKVLKWVRKDWIMTIKS